MQPLILDTIKFSLPKAGSVQEFALTGKQRKQYDFFRHVVKVKVFACNKQTMACLITDKTSKEYSDRYKKNFKK